MTRSNLLQLVQAQVLEVLLDGFGQWQACHPANAAARRDGLWLGLKTSQIRSELEQRGVACSKSTFHNAAALLVQAGLIRSIGRSSARTWRLRDPYTARDHALSHQAAATAIQAPQSKRDAPTARRAKAKRGGFVKTLLNALADEGLLQRTGSGRNASWQITDRPAGQSQDAFVESTPVPIPALPLPSMREVFGDGRIVKLKDGNFGIECLGLSEPAVLLRSLTGDEIPDLTAHEGKVLGFMGQLEAPGGNAEHCRIHLSDLNFAEQEPAVSPMWGGFSGNFGNPPELNPKGDRFVGSIAFHNDPGRSGDEGASWLRLACYSYFSISDLFQLIAKGEPVVCFGAIESYTYNERQRMQLAVRGLQRLPRSGGAAPKPPEVLFRSRDAKESDADAFTDAA